MIDTELLNVHGNEEPDPLYVNSMHDGQALLTSNYNPGITASAIATFKHEWLLL